jgi:hypothetical protein
MDGVNDVQDSGASSKMGRHESVNDIAITAHCTHQRALCCVMDDDSVPLG